MANNKHGNIVKFYDYLKDSNALIMEVKSFILFLFYFIFLKEETFLFFVLFNEIFIIFSMITFFLHILKNKITKKTNN